jgi:hypothetical protein
MEGEREEEREKRRERRRGRVHVQASGLTG